MAGQVKSGIFFDTAEFEKDLAEYAKYYVPKSAKRGLALAGNALIKDAQTVEPKVPKSEDGGALRGSSLVLANPDPNKLSILAGFNIEYAVYVHEMVGKNINWTTPGTGAKFLETKLVRFKNKYMKQVADTIRDEVSRK